ncbi:MULTISPECIES: MarR family winged helix-turn-helix transcriptional regulator [Flammeovirga]|uniref:MarR family transcriptional regulator n=1 Tax=Flammeovirga agarivorans TaxID=2726742 RepID=A0A7X8SQE3_9BACT|nr:MULTISPECIES: MarR family transcriptional regulator [Flammeovirga]NLR94482.1 MarR family transcriptional regulator [Flammeovirga agarivorans]
MPKIEQELKVKFANHKHRFMTNLIYTSKWLETINTNYLKPFNISSQQYNVLRILRGNKDWMNMNDVKALLIDKTPNTTRLSNKLIEKNYIIRKRSQTDRRVVYLKITDEGLELLKQIDIIESKDPFDILHKFTDEEAQQFSDLLDRLRS